MKRARTHLCLAGLILTMVVGFLWMTPSGVLGTKNASDSTVEKRADLIQIDTLKAFGKLQRPPVMFLHQKHTEALEKKNKDCTTCHLIENDRLVPKYMRLEDPAKQTVMDIYHANCIACHKQTAEVQQKSGPVVCGECHNDKSTIVSSWQPIGMDKSLHFRHSKAQKEKCERCHHQYNEVAKKLFYAKGQEGTCRYCHKDRTEENRISLRQASHLGCIDCHRKTLAKFEDAGPITCNGCHDATQQELIERVKVVPRMQRNQPDTVFVKTTQLGNKDSNPLTLMKPVPFNHKAHEAYNDTCRVCHHENLNACGQCHTLEGTPEGKQIKLEQAMHRLNAPMSCRGCHELNQRDPKCAGCHAGIEKVRQQDPAACQVCHMEAATQLFDSAQNTDAQLSAQLLLDARQPIAQTLDDADVPADVEIKALINEYRPVKLPHRKIIRTLLNNINNNRLVIYFHRDESTLCQACHHNSPASKRPPKCASCHGRRFDERDPFKPGLAAAYHRQCMECHQAMGIEKPVATDCTACHQKKSSF